MSYYTLRNPFQFLDILFSIQKRNFIKEFGENNELIYMILQLGNGVLVNDKSLEIVELKDRCYTAYKRKDKSTKDKYTIGIKDINEQERWLFSIWKDGRGVFIDKHKKITITTSYFYSTKFVMSIIMKSIVPIFSKKTHHKTIIIYE